MGKCFHWTFDHLQINFGIMVKRTFWYCSHVFISFYQFSC